MFFRKPLTIFITVYLDDILIYSSFTSQYLQYIEWVLSQLIFNSLYAKPTKCEFGLIELEYLGYISSQMVLSSQILRKLRHILAVGFPHQCQILASVPRFLQLLCLLYAPFCRHCCPYLCSSLERGYLALYWYLEVCYVLPVHCIMQPSCSCPARLYQTIPHWKWCIWHCCR